MNYTMDMCPKTLDLLARTAYIAISPEWTEDDLCHVAAVVTK